MFLAQDSSWAFGWNATVFNFCACLWNSIYPSIFIWKDILHFYETELRILKCKIHFCEQKCVYNYHTKTAYHTLARPTLKDLSTEFMFIQKEHKYVY